MTTVLPRRTYLVLAVALTAPLLASALHGSWDHGLAAYKQGRYEEAIDVFQTYVSSSPEAPEGHYMLGLSLAGQRRFEQAIPALDRAVELAPGNAGYSLSLARALLEAGRASAALDALAGADPEAVPESIRESFNHRLAQAALASGRDRPAYEALERAVAADSSSKSLWLALANVAHRLAMPERRFSALAAVFELDPRDPQPAIKAVKTAIAVAQSEGIDADRKIEWYRRASRVGRALAASFPTADNLMLAGGAEMGGHQYEGAVERFEKPLASGADDRRLRFSLGGSCLPLGRYQEAVGHLQAALDRPGDEISAPVIHAARGLAFRHLEDFDRAAEAYRLAGDVDQATEMAGYAENRRAWAAAKADCVRQRDQIAELRADSEGLEDSAEWQDLEREFSQILTACEPYFKDQG